MSVTQSPSIDQLTAALATPFSTEDIEWRIARSGMKGDRPWGLCLAYITNRAIMERLDATMGPENWCNEFRPWGDKAVLCGLSIRLNGEWVTKWDGADQTDIEAAKGGFSNAMKRAAVQWGIGRYLYKLDEGWATFHEGGPYNALVKRDKNDKGTYFKWAPPALPSWALPDGERSAVRGQQSSRGTTGARDAPPTDFSQPPAALMSDADEEWHDEALTREQPCPLTTKSLPIARMTKVQLKVFEEWVVAHPAASRAEEWLALTRTELAAR